MSVNKLFAGDPNVHVDDCGVQLLADLNSVVLEYDEWTTRRLIT